MYKFQIIKEKQNHAKGIWTIFKEKKWPKQV